MVSCEPGISIENTATGRPLDRHVFADVHRKCRLTHRRTARDDDQLAAVHTRSHAVQINKAGWRAGHVAWIGGVIQRVDPLDHLGQQWPDFEEALRATRAVFGDRKHLRFGFVQQLPDFLALWVECVGGDFVGDGNQPAQHRAIAHDFRIAADIGRAWRVLRQRVQVSQTADVFRLARRAERFVHRDHIGRTRGRDQLADMLEDDSVVVTVEVALREEVGDAVPCRIVEQQAAQHRLLGFDRMRRDFQRLELGIFGRCVHGEELSGNRAAAASGKMKKPAKKTGTKKAGAGYPAPALRQQRPGN
jgi:hypothetical protein